MQFKRTSNKSSSAVAPSHSFMSVLAKAPATKSSKRLTMQQKEDIAEQLKQKKDA
ncbi:hypothetical protein DIPPA_06854 [Diplonema papillatum]|nr:hypothetical protein DIPPA_06854 [Diplonema papillatum]